MTRGCAAERPTLALLLSMGLVACDVGEGTQPVSVRLVDSTGSEGSTELFECGTVDLTALGHWAGSDDYDGDVSASATWETSDAAVVEPGDGITRASSTIVARGPGTALIRVHYLEFSASMVVTVRPIGLRIMPATTHLAPRSRQVFTLEARYDPDEPWAAQATSWSILQENAAAKVEGDTVQALGGPEDVPFLLEARLPECGLSITRELRVSPVSHLSLEHEQPVDQPLPLSLSALIRVLAHFVDPSLEPQDLSSQVEVELEDTESDAATYSGGVDGIALQGLVAGQEVQLSIRYEPLGLTVESGRYRLADLEQETLTVDPAQLSLQFPDEVQLQALGRFSDGIERIVTRHVTWDVSDTNVAEVTSGLLGGGRLTVTRDVDQDLQVEAFATLDGRAVSAEIDIHITRAD
jgi:hypothetical protein